MQEFYFEKWERKVSGANQCMILFWKVAINLNAIVKGPNKLEIIVKGFRRGSK
jgi:hypothetical protein